MQVGNLSIPCSCAKRKLSPIYILLISETSSCSLICDILGSYYAPFQLVCICMCCTLREVLIWRADLEAQECLPMSYQAQEY